MTVTTTRRVSIHDKRLDTVQWCLRFAFFASAAVVNLYSKKWASFEMPVLTVNQYANWDVYNNTSKLNSETFEDRCKTAIGGSDTYILRNCNCDCWLSAEIQPMCRIFNSFLPASRTNTNCQSVLASPSLSMDGSVVAFTGKSDHWYFSCLNGSRGNKCISNPSTPDLKRSVLYLGYENLAVGATLNVRTSQEYASNIKFKVVNSEGNTVKTSHAGDPFFRFSMLEAMAWAGVAGPDALNDQSRLINPVRSLGFNKSIAMMAQPRFRDVGGKITATTYITNMDTFMSRDIEAKVAFAVDMGQWGASHNAPVWENANQTRYTSRTDYAIYVHFVTSGTVGYFNLASLFEMVANIIVMTGIAATIMDYYLHFVHHRVSSRVSTDDLVLDLARKSSLSGVESSPHVNSSGKCAEPVVQSDVTTTVENDKTFIPKRRKCFANEKHRGGDSFERGAIQAAQPQEVVVML